MLKMPGKNLILILVFISYALVLGHSIFPHHHHDHEHAASNSQLHYEIDHSHSDDSNFHDIFHRYFHQGEKVIFTAGHFLHYIKPLKLKFHFSLKNDEILISDLSPPSFNAPPRNSIANFKRILYSYSSLRAPPLS
jgi:hypothetical protein